MAILGVLPALSLACFLAVAGAVLTHKDAGAQTPDGCVRAGVWTRPKDASPMGHEALIRDLAARPVVLLGETHDNRDHHRWQLQMISALHGQNGNMVLAFESFPRSVQPVLDRWIRGELSEKEFLNQSRWFDVWRYEPSLYMPLFHFARINHIPMIAMNVERSLISKIGKDGWDGVSEADREGVTTPAPPSAAYLEYLGHVYGGHDEKPSDDKDKTNDDAFDRFVQAQTAWDRAMAEKLAAVRRAGGEPLVIGIVGLGHVQYGYGIPHQLGALGIRNPAVLLPWDDGKPCEQMKDKAGTPVADAVFGLSGPIPGQETKPQRLGVMIAPADGGGVLVNRVVTGSVAEATGIEDGDVIVKAAGTDVSRPQDLVGIVQNQPDGTFLPLTIRRQGRLIERVARFPVRR